MIIRSALHCALLLALASPVCAAQKSPSKKASKAASKTHAKAVAKKSTAIKSRAFAKTSLTPHRRASGKLHGRKEVIACRNGTEDRHARIAVVLIGGKVDSFAYYSKWKPRTCSIYLQRDRDLSTWSDSGKLTSVSAERGVFMIENGKGVYKFVFRDVDRERYCGMDGKINGTLTIRKGSERCEVAGIMDEGVPLGEAVAHAKAEAAAVAAAEAAARAAAAPPPPAETATVAAEPPAATTAVASAKPAPKHEKASDKPSFLERIAQQFHREPSTAYPGNSVVVGD
jgi:hypothetical protein